MKYFLAHVLIENEDGHRSSAIVPIIANSLEEAKAKNAKVERVSSMEEPGVTVVERHVFETTLNTAGAIIKSLVGQLEGVGGSIDDLRR